MGSITSANSVLQLGVLSVFPVAQQMQGFGTDDAYSMPVVDPAEVVLGVDGIMSYGWIPQIKEMAITLQADSSLIPFFETWYAAQEAVQDVFAAFGLLKQPSISRTYTLANGVLSGYAPIADAKKILQPRKFSIKWNVALGAPG